MLPIALGLIASGLLVGSWLRDRALTLPRSTDRRRLAQFRWYLRGLSLLLALNAAGLALQWVGVGFTQWWGALAVLSGYLAWRVRPPRELSLRIDGLQAREQAIEDHPQWWSHVSKGDSDDER